MKSLLLALIGASCASAEIVINEVLYNAPDDLDLEFIELHHPGDEPIELSSWSLSDEKGTLYTFPSGTWLDPGSFIVVCRAPDLFEEFYEFKAAGTMDHGLGNGGDEVILEDAAGRLIERVAYEDKAPWPVVADGLSASLERLHPSAASQLPDSWAPSPSSTEYKTRPGGTPGRRNAAAVSSEPPRVVEQLPTPERLELDEALNLQLELDPDGPPPSAVHVTYQFVTEAGLGDEQRLPLKSSGFTYTGTIPAQDAKGILRYAFEISGQDGATRRFPHLHALRSMFSVYVSPPVTVGMLPGAHFILPERDLTETRRFRYRQGNPRENVRAQGKDAVVLTDEETGESVLFDFIHITPRTGGHKVRLHKDRLWRGLSTINVLQMYSPRHTLCESLAFEFHRRAGVPASWADYFRVSIDGRDEGIHLAFEQPNKAFLRRHQLDDDGNLYKAIWQGNHHPSPRAYPADIRPSTLIGRHEKKTNVHEDYQDLVDLVERLESGVALDPPDEIINYFAANSLLSHWDGFHNNYFLYHEVSKKTDKWWMFPWDQDKTWGFHDGIHGDEVFVDLPLEAGMEGFLPPGAKGPDRRHSHAIGLPGAPWYRYGGEVSRAVLAHPETRQLFLKRVRELATTVFTEESFGPEIDRLEKRLLPEASSQLQTEIRKTLQLYRTHLTKRRRYVLDQPEIRELR